VSGFGPLMLLGWGFAAVFWLLWMDERLERDRGWKRSPALEALHAALREEQDMVEYELRLWEARIDREPPSPPIYWPST
jgi:hypothetical protein